MPKVVEIQERGVVVDINTGEVFQTKTTIMPTGNYVPWVKVGRKEFLHWFEHSDAPKDKVKAYVIRHVKSDNILAATCEKIATQTGVGANTVTRTLNEMEDANLIKSVGNGLWMVNPTYYFIGKQSAKIVAQKQYDDLPMSRRRKKAENNE